MRWAGNLPKRGVPDTSTAANPYRLGQHRDLAPEAAALSPAVAARSRGARCPVVLGQACHLLVEPLDSPPQGGVLPGLPLDLPPQGLDLLGPVFIAFLLFEPLSVLFWGWFRTLMVYTLYGVLPGAILRFFLGGLSRGPASRHRDLI